MCSSRSLETMPGLVGEVWWEFTHPVFAKTSPGKNWTDCAFVRSHLHLTASILLPSILATPRDSSMGRSLWYPMCCSREMCRQPAAEWATFCCCADSQNHVQIQKLEKVVHGGLRATFFGKLSSQAVTSSLCSHCPSFTSWAAILFKALESEFGCNVPLHSPLHVLPRHVWAKISGTSLFNLS